ncbi:kinase/pyrophosphorylase [Enorma massiliensis]|uniref:pyruvate, water dikinase regulatory protein n=1 Tax=Enorma massiliensis TaxID=1472761 RepID=UPI00195740C1|nr:pyruvate, water dikinase regulatory protein [Enorma massiliensis]MBM6891558.1 kinase/pyrophosphorylase [Enorma massiliensis]
MDKLATVLVISDALGETAASVALAAAGQFDEGAVAIERLSRVQDARQVKRYLESLAGAAKKIAAFHTIVQDALRCEVAGLLVEQGIAAVDLLGPSIDTIAALTGLAPKGIPGIIHQTDERYFQRIACMEYTVEHDDGRGADDLTEADIVLIGVSRTSKTPLSMYLALQGYRVANIPLAPQVEPPQALFEVDPARIFGLVTTVEAIAPIRAQRLGTAQAQSAAGSYADPDAIELEFAYARSLMKRLGCFVVHTDGKAIEESATEIIERLNRILLARNA